MSRVESCAGTVFLLRGRARPISTRGTLLPGTTLFRAGTDRLLLRRLTHMGGPTTSPSLQLLPVSLRCANAFVQEHHRHHRSEEHTSELQSLLRISYAVFCLKQQTTDRCKQPFANTQ